LGIIDLAVSVRHHQVCHRYLVATVDYASLFQTKSTQKILGVYCFISFIFTSTDDAISTVSPVVFTLVFNLATLDTKVILEMGTDFTVHQLTV
jgi:hypothetical protein